MMKKLMMLFGFLVLCIVSVFSQTTDTLAPISLDPITDLGDWVNRFPELQSSLAGVIVQVVFLPPMLIGFFNIAKKQYKYLLTAGVILILTVLAAVMEVGFLHGAKIWFVGATFGLLELGQIIGYALIPGFFNLIEDKFNPWKPKEV